MTIPWIYVHQQSGNITDYDLDLPKASLVSDATVINNVIIRLWLIMVYLVSCHVDDRSRLKCILLLNLSIILSGNFF